MAEPVFCEVPHGSAAYEACLELRREILRKPLGLDFTRDQIEAERADHHLACYVGDDLIGCLTLTPKNEREIKMRQVAVAPHARGGGIGRGLVRFAEEFAGGRGYTKMTLHARESAVRFYERLGCEAVGDWFEEVSIPHRRMEKSLRTPRA